MLPVLFTLILPAGLGLPLAWGVFLVAVVLRAAGYRARERREGHPLGFLGALRADWLFVALCGAALVAAGAKGLLRGELRLPLHSYGVLVASAFVVGVALAQREARRRGQDPERIADLAFWVLVAALLGSQLFFVGVNWRAYFGPGAFWADTAVGRLPRFLVFWETGLVFYGGLIAAALAAAFFLRRHRMPFLAHADTVIPSVAIGHFMGRLGCFAAGCCWGGPAHGDLPWGVRFPPGSTAYQSLVQRGLAGQALLAAGDATTVPLHPVQLYEAFGELALFLVLVMWVRPRKRFHGQVLATWLLGYAVLRGVVELFRGDVERGVWAGLGAGQWTSLVVFAAGALVWARAPRPPAEALVTLPAAPARPN
jgi:phosphatidylglycerol:prolipoprotein diacylglycerol transferase